MRFFKITSVLILSSLILLCTACDSKNTTENNSSETSIITERHIVTTRTARREINPNAEDEDLEGYTTTHDTENRTLENPIPNEPDSDIIATTTTDYHTTTQKGKNTTQTTKKDKTTNETKFVKDKLHMPLNSEKLKSKTKYKVTSDTTYLNLRFGPSKKYYVQLRIPDGVEIYGTARTKDNLNNFWIYVNYKGTFGWVMEELLKVQ